MKKTRIFACFLAFVLCFCTFTVYAEETDGGKNAALGDLNGNGEIDATDYLLLKRFVLGTFTLTAEQEAAADVNHDGSINAVDYMLVKRHVLGTYVIGDGTPGETGFVLPTIMRIDGVTIQLIYKNNAIELKQGGETALLALKTDSNGNLVKATATMPDGSSMEALSCSYGTNGMWPTTIRNDLQEKNASLQYNANGNPVKIDVSSTGAYPYSYSCTLEYNANGKLTKQTNTAVDVFCTYKYDSNGRLQSAFLSSGEGAIYKYNADGTVVTGYVDDALAVEYDYDRNGNITKVEYPLRQETIEASGYTSVSKAQYQCFWLIFEELFQCGAQRMPVAHFSPLV